MGLTKIGTISRTELLAPPSGRGVCKADGVGSLALCALRFHPSSLIRHPSMTLAPADYVGTPSILI